jgi:hypothetical protein
MLVPMLPLKDEMLRRLAEHANLAQFLSFGPGQALPQRHSCVRGHRPGHRFPSPEEGVATLLDLSAGGSVNVRSFQAGAPGGGPFSYGLTRVDDVLAVLRAHDGDTAWVLQLHLASAAAAGTTIHPGTPSRWHRFDPSLGLERLRDLIASVGVDEGIEVAGDIGVTSHAGDLLRRAAIPSRLVESSRR